MAHILGSSPYPFPLPPTPPQVGLESYREWIGLVADFTVESLSSWQWASGSVYYLLGLWSRLVSSMPYLKGDAPSLLDTHVPKIMRAYVASRLDSVRAVAAGGGGGEDPLDSDEQLQDQLDSLPYLCRFQYAETAEYLTGLTDPLIAAYQGYGAGGGGAGDDGCCGWGPGGWALGAGLERSLQGEACALKRSL